LPDWRGNGEPADLLTGGSIISCKIPAGVDDLLAAEASPGLDGLVRELLWSFDHTTLASIRSCWPTPMRSEPLAASAAPTPAAPPAGPPLPVLDWLTLIGTGRHDFAGPLIDALCRAAPSLTWRQTYTLADIGAEFLRNYGYTEIVGPTAPRYSQSLACGFLLLGPQTHYPRHRHEAEEIYVTLSGEASWFQGDGVWRQRPPGTLIHHGSGEPHAMRTSIDPLLALYVWWGAGLAQTARLDGA
jgi:hypothetical protein